MCPTGAMGDAPVYPEDIEDDDDDDTLTGICLFCFLSWGRLFV